MILDENAWRVNYLSHVLQVLPLRQRPADIGPLSEHYALEAAAVRGYRGIDITPAALRQLTSYSFPGNEEVRGMVGGGGHRWPIIHFICFPSRAGGRI